MLRQPVLKGARRLRVADDPADVRVRREAEIAAALEARYAAGVRDGEAAAREACGAELASVFEGLAGAAEAIRRAEEHFLVAAEEEIVRLCILLVEKILSRKVAGDVTEVQALIQKTLATITDAREVAVRVNPDWLEALDKTSEAFAGVISVPEGIRWIPDRRIQKDGAVVETERGQLDASILTQLDEAAALFREVLHERAR